MNKPTIFSGVQPSGNLTIGNYIGAISNWVEIQNDYNSIFCIVDLHAITINQDPNILKSRIIEVTKHYLAAGIKPESSVIFQQSTISEHSELAWILNCVAARMSDLKKMTQFKDKAGTNQENVSVGLFDYPILMSADILLYLTDSVPVGDDQVQHVELCRDLAKRFNNQYGNVFKIPQIVLRKEGARIMSLDNPLKKMSKSSSSLYSYIALLDDPKVASKKIMRATTDEGSSILFDIINKPGISNLITIYSAISKESVKTIEKKYNTSGYGVFKKDLAEIIGNFLTAYQARFNSFSDPDITEILKTGKDKLKPIAEKTLNQVKEKIGLMI
ncbi:MAG: tryptophan--tRNA ligase [bacterium]